MSNKITPALWFSADKGHIEPLLTYYKTIFGDNFSFETIMPLGETPSGYTEMCQATLFGQKYSFMCTEQVHDAFNDACALIINCDDQKEIDMYWNYFTKEGREVQCGWCHDKYGFRWQIIPDNLDRLMANPGAWEVMMGQKKIVIEEYKK